MDRLLLVGLETPEVAAIRDRLTIPFVTSVTLPRIKLDRGVLLVERAHTLGQFLPVSRVAFHGIYEDDFDFIAALALWGGPCLPDATAMMDLRLRIPGLIKTLRISHFGTMKRSMALAGVPFDADAEGVAKWGNWHCGENKEKFRGRWNTEQTTLFEDFVQGEAVRIVLIRDRPWQIRLAGSDWKKSIHPDDACYMDIDPAFLDDARRLQAYFKIDVVGIDYVIGADGTRHLLEVNHIPNVTRFAEIRGAYLDLLVEWSRRDLEGGVKESGPR